MSSRRKRSPEPTSGSSLSSDSGTSSGSDSSSSSDSRSSASPQAPYRREPQRGPAKKRQRSPSPQAARHTQDASPREQHRSSRHTGSGSDRQRTSPQRSHRRAQSPAQQRDHSGRDMSREKQYGDQRQGSRAESQREPVEGTRQRDREPSSRNREPSRRNREPSSRDREPSSRDRQSRHESRDKSDGRHARHERHSDRTVDVNGGNDATKSDRRPASQEHQGSARDQAALPPPPTQPEGINGGQGAAGSGNPGRQNRWAKNDDAGPEQWGKPGNQPDGKQGKEEKPEPEANFALSGKLAAESNTVKGVVLVHQEPPEARKPSQMWRLYGFKNGEPIDKPLYIHRQTCYLFGRERRVADVPLDHPSISKQHAVMQYRHTDKPGADGMMHSGVRPYLMDLGSANGTYLNNDRIEAERYYELLEKDMIKFGHSTREYVLLHAQSNA